MEIIFILITSVFASWLYLSYAPMHEIKDYLMIENMANQKHKFQKD